MRKEINSLLKKELLKRDEQMTVYTFDEHVHVKHQDGSEFIMTHAKHERRKINDRNIIVVFQEHNGVEVFVEVDLEFVKVKPRKGKSIKLKLEKFK